VSIIAMSDKRVPAFARQAQDIKCKYPQKLSRGIFILYYILGNLRMMVRAGTLLPASDVKSGFDIIGMMALLMSLPTKNGRTGWMLSTFCRSSLGPIPKLVLFWEGMLTKLAIGFWAVSPAPHCFPAFGPDKANIYTLRWL